MQKIIDKYTPKNLDEIVSNKKAVLQIKYWAKEHKKPLFIYGDTGVGKTLSAKLIAKEMDWSIYHTDASDIRGKETISQIYNIATSSMTLFGKKRLLLLDEIDAMDDKRGGGDYGGFIELSKIIDKSKQPIIFIANDPYENKKLRPIFEKCEQVKFDLPNKISILKFAKEICDKEEIDYDLVSLKQLIENTKNDIRALLIDLSDFILSKKMTLENIENLGDRKKDEDVFKVLGKIFYPKDFYETKNVTFDMNIDWKLLFAWLEENIPRKYQNPTNLKNAMDSLAKADLYQGRIGATNWILLKYVMDYLTIGIAYAKTEKEIGGFSPFVFPSILKKLSGNKKERLIKNNIVKKIRNKAYCSKHIVEKNHFPILSIIATTNKYNEELIKYFELEHEEIKLLGAKVTKKEYEKIVN
ncbi:MAG: replication factor C large subunit [Candidatus ainarchaeum sp.]|nr:replication factor C large subunit [Candidatus ainarchaeum sp.]MDD3975642.1 replication factor C large subunit [Candidatus ainarchaeum sp.]